jgi:flagellar biosynthesis protein FlhA
MAENVQSGGMGRLVKYSDLIIPGLILVAISILLFPLPSQALDIFLALNLTLSVLVLLVTLYTTEPLQFSSFPSLLLIATLIRLGFNVSATRLILAHGNEGTAAAGRMIEAFGNFVGGNDPVVGFIVFVILVVIQFVVITSGAQRVSEVAARFTLDAMPGKQMAIDADLNSGLITEQEARARREKIAREANFYGAMDGASKFVRGDAIAAIIIVMVNILGGFVIGMLRGNLGWDQVLKTYTLLTIGDGLVTQIPALIIATATGLLVTRSSAETNLGSELTGQVFSTAKPLGIAAAALAVMAVFFPGWSRLPLILVAAAAFFGYTVLSKSKKAELDKKASDEAAKPLAKEPENVTKLLGVDAMELEIGFGLIPLVEEAQGGDLLDRITMIRRQSALDLGLVVPPIRIRDNMQLASEGYSVKIRGTEIARGELLAGRFLAINSTGRPDTLPGTKTKEPTFGLPAVWIEESVKPQAERQGYTVVDPPSVIATHLTEIIRGHAAELITRQDVQRLVDNVRVSNAAVVDELTPAMLNLGEIQKVLQNLLRERVSIRDLTTILENLADHARATKDVDQLTEFVRQALFRSITKAHLSPDGIVHAVTLDPKLEQTLISTVHRGETGSYIALEPRMAQRVISALSKQVEAMSRQGYAPLVLCSPAVRLYFKRLIEKLLPNLTVLSYNELDPKTEIQSSGAVVVNDENIKI